jgi:hypothetical protein
MMYFWWNVWKNRIEEHSNKNLYNQDKSPYLQRLYPTVPVGNKTHCWWRVIFILLGFRFLKSWNSLLFRASSRVPYFFSKKYNVFQLLKRY